MTEITDFAFILLVVAAGLSLAVLATSVAARLLVPAPAIFLVGAALVGEFWPRVGQEVTILTVERVAVVALVVILFNGGMDIGWRRFRVAAAPIISLGLLGTFATAALLAVFAHYVLDFSWMLSGVVAAALAPTDPAVVFSVLGKREIVGRSGTVLEGEAAVNDPAGIALMIGMVELATHADATLLVVLQEFVVEMSIGAVLGVVGGLLLLPVMRHVRLPTPGLYPILALALAGVVYGATSLAHGSGFLAVFVAGLIVGEEPTPFDFEIERFHHSLASLAELIVFVALGLTMALGDLTGRIWVEGIVLAVALALLVRPVVVVATLPFARLKRKEKAFIAWCGLKGAVPILLAAFAVIGGVEGADRVYGIVFVVVLVSVVVQGTPVPFVAKKLGIPMTDRTR